MGDPLKTLLVKTEGIFLVQAGAGEPGYWFGTQKDAQTEAQQQAVALGKPVYVFRAIAKVELTDAPVHWTELAAHGPVLD